MTTQIAVRLPDGLVAYVDTLVGDGAGSRATVVARALNLYRQQLSGERDARILTSSASPSGQPAYQVRAYSADFRRGSMVGKG